MNLPSRGSIILILFFIVAGFILASWMAGFYSLEDATFRERYELIVAVIIVVCVPVYFVFKRLRRPTAI